MGSAAELRRRRGDVAVEILVIAGALMLVVAMTAAVVSHSRNSAAIHDAARRAGYAALEGAVIGSDLVAQDGEIAAGGVVEASVKSLLEDAWKYQLGWLGDKSHNAELAGECENTAKVTGARLEEVQLGEYRGVLLRFGYECEIAAPLGLANLVMTIEGDWAEIAPWMTVG